MSEQEIETGKVAKQLLREFKTIILNRVEELLKEKNISLDYAPDVSVWFVGAFSALVVSTVMECQESEKDRRSVINYFMEIFTESLRKVAAEIIEMPHD